MTVNVLAEGVLRESDYVAAELLNQRARIFDIFLYIAIIAPFFFITFPHTSKNVFGLMVGIVLFTLIGIVFLALLFGLFIIVSAKNEFRQHRVLSEPLKLYADGSGVRIKRPNEELFLPWSHIHKWRSSRKLIILYASSQVFFILPSHIFPEHAAFFDFITTVKSHRKKLN